MNGSQNIPYYIVRKTLAFEKTGQPAAPGLMVARTECPELSSCGLLRYLTFLVRGEHFGEGPKNDRAVDPFVDELARDPPFAMGGKPCPALRPLGGKPFIINIPQPRQVDQHRGYDRFIEFLVTQFCFNLRPTAGTIGKITVRDVLRPNQLFFC